MEYPGKYCRLCRSESDFNVSLFGNYCKKTNIAEKIFVCLKLSIDDRDKHCTICFRCTNDLERCYDFITHVQRAQSSYTSVHHNNNRQIATNNQRAVNSSDISLSFMNKSKNAEEKKVLRKDNSSLLFSFVSPDSNMINDSFLNVETSEPAPVWKPPRPVAPRQGSLVPCPAAPRQSPLVPRPAAPKRTRYSGDMFSSPSPETPSPTRMDWKLTPDESIMQKIRNKCFSHLNFS